MLCYAAFAIMMLIVICLAARQAGTSPVDFANIAVLP
jgi:hypothetical protein